MSSVTINGHTYTDDSNATTGLAAGGHRTRFIPLIADVVVVAGEVESDRAQVAANTATVVADTAIVVADTATAVASAAAALQSEQHAAASEAAALQYKEDAQAISETGLPSQTGNNGKALTTNGATTQWSAIFPDQTGNNGKALITNGSTTLWAAPIPAAHTHLAADLPPVSMTKPFFMAGW